jgi:ribosomal protein S18 acetylase RimI-like enzyme
LVDQAKKWSLERGVTKIELQVFSSNAAAVKFYESLGFNQLSIKMECLIT